MTYGDLIMAALTSSARSQWHRCAAFPPLWAESANRPTGLLGLVLVPRSPREQQIPRGAKICCEIAVIRCAPDPPARRSCVGDRNRSATPLRCCSSASRSGRAAHGRARESDGAPHLISPVLRCPFSGRGTVGRPAIKKKAATWSTVSLDYCCTCNAPLARPTVASAAGSAGA